tara:strand:+ start:1219 stop:1407 length:189 start_codon:yes stop_codon:yes gene_type:complete
MAKLNKKQVLNFVTYVASREKRKLTKLNLKVWEIYLQDFEIDRTATRDFYTTGKSDLPRRVN